MSYPNCIECGKPNTTQDLPTCLECSSEESFDLSGTQNKILSAVMGLILVFVIYVVIWGMK